MRREAERSESSIESARLNAYSDVLEDYAARTYAGRSSEGSQNYLEAESFKQLTGAFEDDSAMRANTAETLMRGVAGRRIFAGTTEIWEGKSGSDRMQALFEHFGVDNEADLLELIESKVGDELYAEPESETFSSDAALLMMRIALIS